MAGAGAGAAAAIAQAIKASGTVVRVEPDDFVRILGRQDNPLVIWAKGGVFGSRLRYLTSYKGFAFLAQCSSPLHIPGTAEVIAAKKIWIPT
jgi:hypothetical protein